MPWVQQGWVGRGEQSQESLLGLCVKRVKAQKAYWWDHSETAEMLENDAVGAEVDRVNHENRWN